ncbi:phosphoribosylformylglycinamidine cyclo-ligase [Lacticaseibacillus paracasei]|uniref:phosphoribosylformylglycinamidine cyclo-ligase n=1 Tax=Lacticaseibacillus paracasei TaxID=1597 RepID=UPI000D346494|nr:phosphoribosylformylglycinamidine cyclo-ligase [Lacticaseibacillus paracasei]PTS59539.1 phosphoribosylformylglycinamidine cyclo-ligase [Lactobacillus sp. DS22_6]MBS6629581.1 phosphoribosylformylglycinamidine cyclo-ligase [Lacticaseibacillus paracasei]MBX4164909.1 phosphoribosylformylglycinamidine cyclo-ligase [Lacticaseibacillus paracasei]MCZ2751319.1 phosphoribosylformylglycinamidine cyclo-ligase [Lacticaseibacillus paracasei]MCZ2761637.1 phosphoribosylformylglycinamidine cyclo-ligase [Lac
MTDYKDAGVDIEAGEAAVQRIAALAKETTNANVLASVGGFAAAYRLPEISEPTLISATDGVGTKLLLALQCDAHETVGIDLVAMVANDLLASGAQPLFFLDYMAVDHLDVDRTEAVVRGIAYGCQQAQMALIGGETAEMPDMYPQHHYDLAGFAVGLVSASKRLPQKVAAGDVLIGLPSSGVHSNGYSMVRKLLAETDLGSQSLDDGSEMLNALMRPTRIYVKEVLPLMQQGLIHAAAHITGGGITENLPRVIPDGLVANIDPLAWQRPELFDRLQHAGHLSETTMRSTFNLGIGMILVVPEQAVSLVQDAIPSSKVIGTVGEDPVEKLHWQVSRR